MVLFTYINIDNDIDNNIDYDECYNLYFNKNIENTVNPYDLYDLYEQEPTNDETFFNLYIEESYILYKYINCYIIE